MHTLNTNILLPDKFVVRNIVYLVDLYAKILANKRDDVYHMMSHLLVARV